MFFYHPDIRAFVAPNSRLFRVWTSMEVVLFPLKTFDRLGLENRCKRREMEDSLKMIYACFMYIGLYGLYKFEMIVRKTGCPYHSQSYIYSCLVICRVAMAYFINCSLIFTFHESIVGPSIHPKYGKTPAQRWCKYPKPLFVSLKVSEPSQKNKSSKVFGDKFNGTTVEEILAQVGEGCERAVTSRKAKWRGGPGRVQLSENMTLEIPEKHTWNPNGAPCFCWNFGLVFVVFFPFKNRGWSLGFQVCNHQSLAVEIL